MILGIDPGTRRVGVAIADEVTRFAVPVEVIDASATDVVERIAALVTERDVRVVVVGLPVGLSGRAGPAVDTGRALVERLRAVLAVPVEEHDERLTTVVAEMGLRRGGARPAARKKMRDAVAAQVMLQGYLDSHPG